MISAARLAELDALAEAATPGPWFSKTEAEAGDWPTVYTVVRGKDDDDLVAEMYPVTAEANAQFIAAARTAVPELAAEVRRLRGALEHGSQQLEALGEAWRCDWLGFDGRQLRDQLSKITMWMRQPEGPLTEGTEFYHSHITLYHDFFPGCPKEFGCFRCERKRRKRARVKRPITKRPLPIHKEVKAPWIK